MKVKEIFGPTIQGEGIHAGEICSFIRFAGCDQKPCCKWCDTLDAYNIESGEEMKPVDIYEKISQDTNTVILTGGNPCIQDNLEMYTLLYLLKQKFKVYIETQGTIFPAWLYELNHITISPKPPSAYNYEQFGQDITAIKNFINDYCNALINCTKCIIPSLEFKIVVFTEEDLKYAYKVFKEVNAQDLIIPKTENDMDNKVSNIISKIDNLINYTIQIGTDIHKEYSIKKKKVKHSVDRNLFAGYAYNIVGSDTLIDKITIVGWSENDDSEIHNIDYTIYKNTTADKTSFEIDIDKNDIIEGEVNFKYKSLLIKKIDNRDITIHCHIEYKSEEAVDNKQLITTNEIINWIVKMFPKELVSKVKILPQIHRILEVK